MLFIASMFLFFIFHIHNYMKNEWIFSGIAKLLLNQLNDQMNNSDLEHY